MSKVSGTCGAIVGWTGKPRRENSALAMSAAGELAVDGRKVREGRAEPRELERELAPAFDDASRHTQVPMNSVIAVSVSISRLVVLSAALDLNAIGVTITLEGWWTSFGERVSLLQRESSKETQRLRRRQKGTRRALPARRASFAVM
jgi:hypothetical protein